MQEGTYTMLPHQPPFNSPAPSYATVHRHARRRIATVCAHCGATERLEAALKPDTPSERIIISASRGRNYGLRYSANLDDYEALCFPCHRWQDLGGGRPRDTCRQGHFLTEDNVRRRPDGSQTCLTCYRATYKRAGAALRNDPERYARSLAWNRAYRQTPEGRAKHAERVRAWRARRAEGGGA